MLNVPVPDVVHVTPALFVAVGAVVEPDKSKVVPVHTVSFDPASAVGAGVMVTSNVTGSPAQPFVVSIT